MDASFAQGARLRGRGIRPPPWRGLVCLRETRGNGKRRGHDGVLNRKNFGCLVYTIDKGVNFERWAWGQFFIDFRCSALVH
jgi:hypothetical protein